MTNGRIVQAGLALGTVGVVVIGVWLGANLWRPGPVELLARQGQLFEVHTLGGGIIIGQFQEDAGGYIRLSGPASVVTASDSASPAQYVVELLRVEPYNLADEILITREQISLAGTVASGSSLERAYLEALGAPSSTPSPGP